MTSYSVGLSLLAVGQRGLDVVGQNVANAATPGYHRQELNLVSKSIDGTKGSGVEVAFVRRYTNDAVSNSLRQAGAEAARLSSRVSVRRQAEAVLASGEGAIDGRLEQFFNQIEQLTSRPEDRTQRRIVLSQASALATQFQNAAGDLDQLRSNVGAQVRQSVEEINSYAPRIAKLNERIATVEATGQQANDLRDARDQLISEVSGFADVRVIPQEFGVANVFIGGVPLVISDTHSSLVLAAGVGGVFSLSDQVTGTPVTLKSGKLLGLMEEHNTQIPADRAKLDTLAQELIRRVDSVQATGLNDNGPFTLLTGSRSVGSPTVPLASAGLSFPAQAGSLVISVTNQTTGARNNVTLAVNPATQSLQDIATAITSGTSGNVQASIDTATNTLRLQSQTGFAFDFAGRLPTSPTSLAMGGTATPKIIGTYTGSNNDTFTFNILGSGTIGTTAGLQMEVRNSANAVIATLNVGSGYTPDAPLKVADGIQVKLSAGTTANGTFSIPVTGQPDSANLLTALGVNTFFTGVGANTIAVRSDLLNDPAKLSTSRSGEIGDASNLERLAALRDQKFLGAGTESFRENYASILGSVGVDVRSLSDQRDAQESLQRSLYSEEQASVGVDINEEMVNLLQYQRMVESSSRYMSVLNRALEAIMEMVR